MQAVVAMLHNLTNGTHTTQARNGGFVANLPEKSGGGVFGRAIIGSSVVDLVM